MTGIGHLLLRRGPDIATFPPLYLHVRTIVSSKLFVGGLSHTTHEEYLRQAFSAHGDVQNVRIMTDRETGRSRGFGYVTFSSEADAAAALRGMNGKVFNGRAIRVDYASNSPSKGVGFWRSGSFGGDIGGFGGVNGFGGKSIFGASLFGDGDGSTSEANFDDDGDAVSDNAELNKYEG